MTSHAFVRIAAMFAAGLLVSSLAPGAARAQAAGGAQEEEYMRGSMATAFHPDVAAVWGTAGHPTRESAEQRVMDACNAAMGGGCRHGEGWTGQAMIAVALDRSGGVWIKGGAYTKDAAEAAAISDCVDGAPGSLPCRIDYSFSNPVIRRGVDGTRDYFPEGTVERHHWILHAWPDSPPPAWSNKTWISTGRRNYAEARDELLAGCAADTGVPCTVNGQVPNGVIAHYVNKRGRSYWVGAVTATAAPTRVREVCPAGEQPCRIITVYDSANDGLQVVADPPLTRGFASVAWPTVAGWDHLAIVTGRETIEEANADALALCRSRSQLPCALYLDNPDSKTASFMGMYSLPGDRLHMLFANSAADLSARAAEAGRQSGTPYTSRAVVDLHERGEITPEY